MMKEDNLPIVVDNLHIAQLFWKGGLDFSSLTRLLIATGILSPGFPGFPDETIDEGGW